MPATSRSTVGGDIIGVENVVDTLARGNPGNSYDATLASGLTSNPGAFIGQFWLPWLLTNSTNNPNVPWYVNFGSFDQGIMSVGGDIAGVKAGGDIHDLAVSTATTSWPTPTIRSTSPAAAICRSSPAAVFTAAISTSAKAQAASGLVGRDRLGFHL